MGAGAASKRAVGGCRATCHIERMPNLLLRLWLPLAVAILLTIAAAVTLTRAEEPAFPGGIRSAGGTRADPPGGSIGFRS